MIPKCSDCGKLIIARIDCPTPAKVYRVDDRKLCEGCFVDWNAQPPSGYTPRLVGETWSYAPLGRAQRTPEGAWTKTNDDGDLVKAINRLAAAVESLVKKGK